MESIAQVLECEIYFLVSDSQQNLNILRALVMQLQEIIYQENQKCWGKPLGSQNLWKGHLETIQRIQHITNEIRISGPGPEIRPKLHDLPEECVREIILRLADYRDLEASSTAWSLMSALVAEQRVWRELTYFHFTPEQIQVLLEKEKHIHEDGSKDWKKIYHALRK